jgi:hypothetical protein
MKNIFLFTSLVAITTTGMHGARAGDEPTTFTGEKTSWHGAEQRGRPNNGVRPYPAAGVTSIASFRRI